MRSWPNGGYAHQGTLSKVTAPSGPIGPSRHHDLVRHRFGSRSPARLLDPGLAMVCLPPRSTRRPPWVVSSFQGAGLGDGCVGRLGLADLSVKNREQLQRVGALR
jgi:hypothetical protein